MSRKSLLIIIALVAGLSFSFFGNWLVLGQQSGLKKWQKGKGWGWVWGKDDEVGALNEMTDASRMASHQGGRGDPSSASSRRRAALANASA